jgi:hypothetical protein
MLTVVLPMSWTLSDVHMVMRSCLDPAIFFACAEVLVVVTAGNDCRSTTDNDTLASRMQYFVSWYSAPDQRVIVLDVIPENWVFE